MSGNTFLRRALGGCPVKTLNYPSSWLSLAREWALQLALLLGSIGFRFYPLQTAACRYFLGFCFLTLGVANAHLVIMRVLGSALFKGIVQ